MCSLQVSSSDSVASSRHGCEHLKAVKKKPKSQNVVIFFSPRNKQRMHFALKSLLQEAQNNLKIFKVNKHISLLAFFALALKQFDFSI